MLEDAEDESDDKMPQNERAVRAGGGRPVTREDGEDDDVHESLEGLYLCTNSECLLQAVVIECKGRRKYKSAAREGAE